MIPFLRGGQKAHLFFSPSVLGPCFLGGIFNQIEIGSDRNISIISINEHIPLNPVSTCWSLRDLWWIELLEPSPVARTLGRLLALARAARGQQNLRDQHFRPKNCAGMLHTGSAWMRDYQVCTCVCAQN
jgi:hypothetical protein